MELSSTVFTDFLTPLAAFPHFEPQQQQQEADKHLDSTSHDRSLLPPTRPHYKWRLDGADVDGRRLFAVPLFALGKKPLRVDVYLPDFERFPLELRNALRPEALIYSTKQEVPILPISKYVLEALESWSEGRGDGFEKEYLDLPFGSAIVFENITPSPHKARIELLRNDNVEQAMMGVHELKNMWHEKGGVSEESWPRVIDLHEIKFQRQIHEAITIATLPDLQGDDRPYVFKSLLRDQRYMYNELKTLLSFPPHENLVPRPLYVVTKELAFGTMKGVCGFVMEYFPLGSLKEYLLSEGEQISLRQRFRFAKQITEVLMHVNKHPLGFYPDLKPDNIVLRRAQGRDESFEKDKTTMLDAVLLDLEQRGGWFAWSPPEIAYVEYFEILGGKLDEAVYGGLKEGIVRRLRAFIPDWRPVNSNALYYDSDGGFSGPWLALLGERNGVVGKAEERTELSDSNTETKSEGKSEAAAEDETKKPEEKQPGGGSERLEKAQVFMLGKMLWCLFEGQARVRCGIDHEVLQGNDLDLQGHAFPEFKHAPERIRELIKRCTSGAPEWDSVAREKRQGVVLRGGKLFPAETKKGQEEGVSAEDTVDAARKYWANELELANGFIQELLVSKLNPGSPMLPGGILEKAKSRPLLGEVLTELMEVEQEILD